MAVKIAVLKEAVGENRVSATPRQQRNSLHLALMWRSKEVPGTHPIGAAVVRLIGSSFSRGRLRSRLELRHF